MGSEEELGSLVERWLEWDKDEETRAEVERLRSSKEGLAELAKRMGGRMSFGTAGLRARMEAGFARMNALTIIQTTQGFRAHLASELGQEALAKRGVVVGWDGRHRSRRFADLAAAAFTRHGVPVALFSAVVPTPFVAFAVAELGAAAGIMVTASHNPKEDNGYKAYWTSGAQLLRPHDAAVLQAIQKHLVPEEGAWDTGLHKDLVTDPLDKIRDLYTQRHLRDFSFSRETNGQSGLKMCYSAFHGVGGAYTPQLLKDWGFPQANVSVVAEQQEPNGDFPTITGFPNPEEGASVLGLCFRRAEEAGASLLLVNDPDADRLQLAQRKADGAWRVFTGNEMGALLADWVWRNWARRHPGDADVHFLNSAVSSQLVGAMAAKEGFHYEQTLTGFKWMAERADALRREGKRVLLAWEESIGFMPGAALDKDGVVAAGMFAELAGSLGDGGLEGQLHAVYRAYGYHLSRNSYFLVPSPDVRDAVFRDLRETPPRDVAGVAVGATRDLTVGTDTAQPDGRPLLPVDPKSQMITYTLADGSIVTVRASGTEPKLKYYIELKTEAGLGPEEVPRLQQSLDRLEAAVTDSLLRAKHHGLVPKA